jgi:WhiB family redox-sensing transcriptional regulator
MSNHMPNFVNHASCTDYDPELWFPVEKNTGRHRLWTKTPEVMKARSICSKCPALSECFNYSIQYEGLYGIWAGLDWFQRRDIQRSAKLKPIDMLSTVPHYVTEGLSVDEE